jgi:hypothetical protein
MKATKKPAGALAPQPLEAGAPLYTFGKNSREQIQATLSHFRGELYIDIRTYWQGDEGDWRPSKKGVCVHVDLFTELEAALAAIRGALEERGRAA